MTSVLESAGGSRPLVRAESRGSAAPVEVPRDEDGLAWISWLRVVAIVGVVGIHTTGHTAIAGDARQTFRGQLAIWIDAGAVFAVPVFVMMSGALLLDHSRYPGHATFLRKRVWRLVPPLLFWHVWYYLLLRFHLDRDLSVADALLLTVNGKLYTALYFFWIVLGLAIITPVLVPFLASAGRRGALMAGGAATLMTAVTMASKQWRGAPVVFVDTAWTWWIPYLGLFVLGWALRGVILTGVRRWAASGMVAGLGVLLVWQWRNPAAPSWLNTFVPNSYYGATSILYSILVFMVFQSMLHAAGPLRSLLQPRLNRIARTLGDATLGVFALHLTVLLVVLELPVIGGEEEAPRALFLLARYAVVVGLTFLIVLALRRVPVVKVLV